MTERESVFLLISEECVHAHLYIGTFSFGRHNSHHNPDMRPYKRFWCTKESKRSLPTLINLFKGFEIVFERLFLN